MTLWRRTSLRARRGALSTGTTWRAAVARDKYRGHTPAQQLRVYLSGPDAINRPTVSTRVYGRSWSVVSGRSGGRSNLPKCPDSTGEISGQHKRRDRQETRQVA